MTDGARPHSEDLASPRFPSKNGYLDSVVEYFIIPAGHRPRRSPNPWISSTSTCIS